MVWNGYLGFIVSTTSTTIWVITQYMIKSKECPENHPIYAIDIDMGSTIFYNQSPIEQESHSSIVEQKQEIEEKKQEVGIDLDEKEKWWVMHFDGVVSKEGEGAWIDITAPILIKKILFSFKFYFECTNNVVEHEALILGLKILKELQAKRVYIYGYSNLVIK